MTNEDRLKALLDIEEKNDIFNLTSRERGEFQSWVKNLLVSLESAEEIIFGLKEDLREAREELRERW